MKLRMVHIPDEPAELARWLEAELVGLHLPELVAELAAVHGTNGDVPRLEELLGDDYGRALEAGLCDVPHEKLGLLLQHPQCLLDLHDALTTHGGEHWSNVQSANSDLQKRGAAGRTKIQSWLAESTPTPPIPTEAIHPLHVERPPAGRLRGTIGVLMALAATLMLGFFLGQLALKPTPTAPAVAWGWAKPGAMPETDDSPAYLRSLAETANAWFNKRPTAAVDVATRISEFRQGCTQLMLADHEPLSDEDEAWLKERCRAWADDLDEHLAQIEQGADPIEVRNSVDEMIRRMMTALRERATTV